MHTHTHTHTHTPSYNQEGIPLSSPDRLATPCDCALLQASAEYSPHCLSGRHQRDTAGQLVCPVWREVHVGCVWGRGQLLFFSSHTPSHYANNFHPPLFPSLISFTPFLILHSFPLSPSPPSLFPHTLLFLPSLLPLPALPASLLCP